MNTLESKGMKGVCMSLCMLYLSFFSLAVTKDTLSTISFGIYFIFEKYVSYISSNFQHCSFARMSRKLAPYHFLAMYFRYMAIL